MNKIFKMIKNQFSTILLCFVCCVMISSCAKEEAPILQDRHETVVSAQTAESYLAANKVPAIMFSYNSYDPETNLLTSWLIDDEGNIRSAEMESDIVYESGVLSPYYMETKKDRSDITNSNVDLEELVDNFKDLHNASQLTYNAQAEAGKSQQLTTVYGYYYVSANHDESCSCDNGDTSDTDQSLNVQLYNAVLLEQKSGSEVIQTNARASSVLAWLHALNVEGE